MANEAQGSTRCVLSHTKGPVAALALRDVVEEAEALDDVLVNEVVEEIDDEVVVMLLLEEVELSMDEEEEEEEVGAIELSEKVISVPSVTAASVVVEDEEEDEGEEEDEVLDESDEVVGELLWAKTWVRRRVAKQSKNGVGVNLTIVACVDCWYESNSQGDGVAGDGGDMICVQLEQRSGPMVLKRRGMPSNVPRLKKTK